MHELHPTDCMDGQDIGDVRFRIPQKGKKKSKEIPAENCNICEAGVISATVVLTLSLQSWNPAREIMENRRRCL